MMRKKNNEKKKNKNPSNASTFGIFDKLPNEILMKIGSYLNTQGKARLSNSCHTGHSFFQVSLDLAQLLQAIFHDEQETVKKILDSNPRLLRLNPKAVGLLEIQSQLTWQTFIVSDLKPFELAVITRQCNLVKIMQSYLIKLENGQEEAKKQWARAEAILKKQKKHYDFNQLIHVIKKEPGTVDNLSEATKAALQTFRDKLLPKQAVGLPDYYDMLQVLIHAYQAYDKAYNGLNDEQCRIFSINVFGFIQSLLARQDAKEFRQFIYALVKKKGKKIGKRPADYRISYNSISSLGWYICCDVALGAERCRWVGAKWCGEVLEQLRKAKTTELERLKKQLLRSTKSVSAPKRCLIS